LDLKDDYDFFHVSTPNRVGIVARDFNLLRGSQSADSTAVD
jgi:hypothetical protein